MAGAKKVTVKVDDSLEVTTNNPSGVLVTQYKGDAMLEMRLTDNEAVSLLQTLKMLYGG